MTLVYCQSEDEMEGRDSAHDHPLFSCCSNYQSTRDRLSLHLFFIVVLPERLNGFQHIIS